jgi:uncharacterized protein YndB with AHSA1/START domain
MSESVIESIVQIAAPPEQVWATITDTRRYAEWVENTDEVVGASSQVATTGVTYEERNTVAGPVKGRSRWRVESVDGQRHTVHTGEGIAVVKGMRLEMTVLPDGEGTRYEHRLYYTPAFGPLGPLINLVLRPSVQGATDRGVRNLKAICEREARG